jgi:hypothetical protein
VCFRLGCFLGDGVGATSALLLQNSAEAIKASISSGVIPVLLHGAGAGVFARHADDASRQAALFALACYHGDGAEAMRAGLWHNNIADVKAAMYANRIPVAPPAEAQRLLEHHADDVSRNEVSLLFLCNQGDLPQFISGLVRLASVETTTVLIRDLANSLPTWIDSAKDAVLAAVGSGESEAVAAVGFLIA